MRVCKTDRCRQGREECPTPDVCQEDEWTWGKVIDVVWSMLAGIGMLAIGA